MINLLMKLFDSLHDEHARCSYREISVLISAFLFCAMPALAQNDPGSTAQGNPDSIQQHNPVRSPNDLLNDNLNLVSASPAQIALILKANPGLLLELKNLVAKDAADHGQIVLESDLADIAIYSRLITDEKFRAAATRLLQRYGYLLPKINPASDLARDQELLRQLKISQAMAGSQANPQAQATPSQAQQAPAQMQATPAQMQQSPTQMQPNLPQQSTPGLLRAAAVPPELPQDTTSSNMLIDPSAAAMQAGMLSGGNSLRATLSNTSASLGMGGDSGRAAGNTLRDAMSSAGSSVLAGAGTDQAALLQTLGSAAGLSFPYGSSPSYSPAPSPLASASSPSPLLSSSAPQFGPASSLAQPPPSRSSFEAEVTSDANMPQVTTHKSFYSGVPAIYDIYAHAATGIPGSGPVTRFGENVFENLPANFGNIPIDFPASPDYVVGPGDGLTINMWGGVSQRISNSVDHEGRITLPQIGPVLVSGQSLSEVQQTVQRLLRTQFRAVSADVSLSRLRTVRIYVVGDVQNPGAYDVSSLSTPLNALLAAGGPNSSGSLRLVKHYRGNTPVQEVDLYDLLLRGVRSDVKRLEAGDTLLVPPVGAEVHIDGMVRRPAVYELHGETNLAQVIDLAGGILPTAALSHIEVQRLEAHDKRTMLSLDIPGTTNPDEIEKKFAAFSINDRDEIHIFPIAGFNQDAVYLQGHVLRQGRYSYKNGMTLTDLVSSYQDLLPEPATKYAEIIHLNPPDFHPSVESFDLATVLANPTAAPKLQPQDTVRIFSRFDFEDAPAVSVTGAVRTPGSYPTSGQIHVRDALQLAGGLAPDASTDSAQIIRPTEDGSLTILNVRLKEAMEGDPINNILLQPRDHILVQQSMLRADPSSIQIGGEVVNPGRYPLTGNLRISDLVRVAGGFKRGADSGRADLTEFVRSEDGSIRASHINIDLAEAIAGDPSANITLHDGDVLTIRQIPGWTDLGALVRVRGEVKHPGTYGIRPGERLSSMLERAGGFQPDGYPYGAVLERDQVQQLEAQSRDQMILRVQGAQNELALLPDTDPKEKVAREMAIEQWQSALEELNANPPIGRIAIRISSNIDRWKNTPADIQLQAGDTLIVPKKPGYVMVTGQVFNATAVSYRPGKSASWYLGQAGGPTPLANKRAIFVVRADGSVIGEKNGLLIGDSLRTSLEPGDMVVVPEKALSGNVRWQDVLLSAQVASSITSAIFIGLRY